MSGMRVEWIGPQQDSDQVLDLWVQVQLVRIAQEALTNARHRRATRAWVSYREQDGRAQIVIQDDGAAPAPSQIAVPHSLSGPRTMRERAEEVGVRLEVRPAPDGGTQVVIEIPPHPLPTSRPPGGSA
jgi:signal transduction histidine kinase